jgi:1-acyl-sn-glycerol-3-phosphate acyltransferase
MQDHLLHPRALPTWGQNVQFRPLPGPHGIAVVYPHTSNWDFPVGLLAKWAVGVQFRWLAKDSLFRGPMGALMRYWGGVPIDRSAPQGAARRLATTMLAANSFWLAITPEGTRSYRPHWKSGFYRIALEAKVPVLLVALDYGRKVVDVTRTIVLTGDEAADMAAIAQAYEGVRAMYPTSAAPIRLADNERGAQADSARDRS